MNPMPRTARLAWSIGCVAAMLMGGCLQQGGQEHDALPSSEPLGPHEDMCLLPCAAPVQLDNQDCRLFDLIRTASLDEVAAFLPAGLNPQPLEHFLAAIEVTPSATRLTDPGGPVGWIVTVQEVCGYGTATQTAYAVTAIPIEPVHLVGIPDNAEVNAHLFAWGYRLGAPYDTWADEFGMDWAPLEVSTWEPSDGIPGSLRTISHSGGEPYHELSTQTAIPMGDAHERFRVWSETSAGVMVFDTIHTPSSFSGSPLHECSLAPEHPAIDVFGPSCAPGDLFGFWTPYDARVTITHHPDRSFAELG